MTLTAQWWTVLIAAAILITGVIAIGWMTWRNRRILEQVHALASMSVLQGRRIEEALRQMRVASRLIPFGQSLYAPL